MDLGLKDRVYVVTGGGRGLGLAAARELAAEGAKVVLSGRTAATVDKAAAELGGPERALGVVADNADPQTAELLLATARTRFGAVDGVLISVGGPPPGSAADVGDEQWQTAF